MVAMAGALEKLHAALVEPSHAVRSYVLEGKAMDAIAVPRAPQLLRRTSGGVAAC